MKNSLLIWLFMLTSLTGFSQDKQDIILTEKIIASINHLDIDAFQELFYVPRECLHMPYLKDLRKKYDWFRDFERLHHGLCQQGMTSKNPIKLVEINEVIPIKDSLYVAGAIIQLDEAYGTLAFKVVHTFEESRLYSSVSISNKIPNDGDWTPTITLEEFKDPYDDKRWDYRFRGKSEDLIEAIKTENGTVTLSLEESGHVYYEKIYDSHKHEFYALEYDKEGYLLDSIVFEITLPDSLKNLYTKEPSSFLSMWEKPILPEEFYFTCYEYSLFPNPLKMIKSEKVWGNMNDLRTEKTFWYGGGLREKDKYEGRMHVEEKVFLRNGNLLRTWYNGDKVVKAEADTYEDFLTFPRIFQIRQEYSSKYKGNVMQAYRSPKGWHLISGDTDALLWSFETQSWNKDLGLDLERHYGSVEDYLTILRPDLPFFHCNDCIDKSIQLIHTKKTFTTEDSIQLYLLHVEKLIQEFDKKAFKKKHLKYINSLLPKTTDEEQVHQLHKASTKLYAITTVAIGATKATRLVQTTEIPTPLKSLAKLILDEQKEGEVLFSDSLQPLLYLYQQQESYREDVRIIDLEKLDYPWYRKHLEQEYDASIFHLPDSLYNRSEIFTYFDPYELEYKVSYEKVDSTLNYGPFLQSIEEKGLIKTYKRYLSIMDTLPLYYNGFCFDDLHSFGFAGLEIVQYLRNSGIKTICSDNFYSFNDPEISLYTCRLYFDQRRDVFYQRDDLPQILKKNDLSPLLQNCFYKGQNILIMSHLLAHYYTGSYEDKLFLLKSIVPHYKYYYTEELENRIPLFLKAMIKEKAPIEYFDTFLEEMTNPERRLTRKALPILPIDLTDNMQEHSYIRLKFDRWFEEIEAPKYEELVREKYPSLIKSDRKIEMTEEVKEEAIEETSE